MCPQTPFPLTLGGNYSVMRGPLPHLVPWAQSCRRVGRSCPPAQMKSPRSNFKSVSLFRRSGANKTDLLP